MGIFERQLSPTSSKLPRRPRSSYDSASPGLVLSPPPPPYSTASRLSTAGDPEKQPPIVATQTTVTTTRTTTTTTHFFPLWRRREPTAVLDQRTLGGGSRGRSLVNLPSMLKGSDEHPQESSNLGRVAAAGASKSNLVPVEKELPALPPRDSSGDVASNDYHKGDDEGSEPHPKTSITITPSSPPTPSHSPATSLTPTSTPSHSHIKQSSNSRSASPVRAAQALAQASLGIGLPPTMPSQAHPAEVPNSPRPPSPPPAPRISSHSRPPSPQSTAPKDLTNGKDHSPSSSKILPNIPTPVPSSSSSMSFLRRVRSSNKLRQSTIVPAPSDIEMSEAEGGTASDWEGRGTKKKLGRKSSILNRESSRKRGMSIGSGLPFNLFGAGSPEGKGKDKAKGKDIEQPPMPLQTDSPSRTKTPTPHSLSPSTPTSAGPAPSTPESAPRNSSSSFWSRSRSSRNSRPVDPPAPPPTSPLPPIPPRSPNRPSGPNSPLTHKPRANSGHFSSPFLLGGVGGPGPLVFTSVGSGLFGSADAFTFGITDDEMLARRDSRRRSSVSVSSPLVKVPTAPTPEPVASISSHGSDNKDASTSHVPHPKSTTPPPKIHPSTPSNSTAERAAELSRSPSTGTYFMGRRRRSRGPPRGAESDREDESRGSPRVDQDGAKTPSPASSKVSLRPGRTRSFSLLGATTPLTPPTPSPDAGNPPSIPSTTSAPSTLQVPPNTSSSSSPSSVTFSNLRPPQPRTRSPTTSSSAGPPLLRRLSQTFFPSASSSSFSSFSHLSDTPPMSNRDSSDQRPKTGIVPEPRVDAETPEVYLGRVMEAVSKAEVAGVLASSGDAFHTAALKAYMDRFNFADDPLDVALRRLLMDLGLPRETQQIDRVMEGFASRYETLNPGLFSSKDHAYILSFSLMMLHTDAFNKSNKNKMNKADYVKNTRLPGVAPEVLDYFFDNITFAPFIFIEDPMDINGQKGFAIDGPGTPGPSTGIISSTNGSLGGGGTSMLGKAKIDPYFLITQNLLDPLRVDVESQVPTINPYSYTGTTGMWDEGEVHHAFIYAESIEMHEPARRKSVPFPSFGDGGEVDRSMRTLKVTKAGVLVRKEDLGEGGKKVSSRKWKEWSVILTGSQLLFFKDVAWVSGFLGDAETSESAARPTTFKPDEVISLKDSLAVYDATYSKYAHAFRFVMPNGRQFLMQASSEKDLNEWIGRINYASAFKSMGIRMRSMGMTGDQAMSTGAAAALSHVKDVRRAKSSERGPLSLGSSQENLKSIAPIPKDILPPRPVTAPRVNGKTHRAVISGVPSTIDLESPTSLHSDGKLEETFNEVKAELAAVRGLSLRGNVPNRKDGVRANSLGGNSAYRTQPQRGHTLAGDSIQADDIGFLQARSNSRSVVVQSKIRDLDSKITTAELALESDLRLARNLAVLAPFLRSTRERIQTAVIPVAKTVRLLRMDLIKQLCYRDVLKADLLAEEKEWQRTKELALRAANRELRSRRKAPPSYIPTVELSVHTDFSEAPLSASDADTPTIPKLESKSSARSLSSFDPPSGTQSVDRISTDEDSNASSSKLAPLNESIVFNPSSSLDDQIDSPAFPFPPQTNDTSSQSLMPPSSTLSPPNNYNLSDSALSTPVEERPAVPSNPNTIPEEESAEDWNRTRAAKRVSLVRVPSQAQKLSVIFAKHGHGLDGGGLPVALEGSVGTEESG